MRRAWIVILAAFGLLGGVAWLVFRPAAPQPVAYGQPLDYWLNKVAARTGPLSYRYPRTTNAPTDEHTYQEALAAIGPKAVPFILRKLGTNDSPLRNWYRQKATNLPAWIVNRVGKPGTITFDTRSAYDAITRLDTNHSAVLPVMLGLVNSGNPAFREVAVQYVSYNFQPILSTNRALGVFRRAARDNDPAVRLYGIQALGNLGSAASNALPELIDSLSANEAGRHAERSERWYVRTWAAKTLGSIGPGAAVALPALTNLALTGDGYQRTGACKAIWQITSNLDFVLPHLLADLPKLGDSEKPSAIEGIGEIGPGAISAVPVLLKEYEQANSLRRSPKNYYPEEILRYITNALERIDPDALKQLEAGHAR